jgi:hypothetical protein
MTVGVHLVIGMTPICQAGAGRGCWRGWRQGEGRCAGRCDADELGRGDSGGSG